MRGAFAEGLRCPCCRAAFAVEVREERAGVVREAALRAPCGRAFPVIEGVPRILPPDLAADLPARHPAFFERHPDLGPVAPTAVRPDSLRTQRAFGDEWRRFPELLAVHERIFHWYFEGPRPPVFEGRRVLDAGCGMGRWLHFVRRSGAEVVGMDASPAIDVAAAREGDAADFVQADLRWPPFPPSSFDLVYSFGVVHHLEEPEAGVGALAGLVRPGGELRLYVYRSLEDEGLARRALLGAVTLLRRVTTRLPYAALHAVSWMVSALATAFFLLPRRLLRRAALGDRLTRGLPLVHYADVPFRMLVAEQFDRVGAPLEGRYRADEVEGWLRRAGLEVEAILPDLGWRVIARRPDAGSAATAVTR